MRHRRHRHHAGGRVVPSSTYRLQLHAGFTFADAEAVVPRLADLGVGALYLSPVLAHTPGSTHGYDVVDHSRVDDELGGREGLERLARRAHDAGLLVVVDVVPNHMSVAAPEQLNRQWWSLLADGPDGEGARWFDVDWAAGDGRVVLPVLGDDVDAVRRDGDVVRYHDHAFPADDRHYRLAHWREAPGYRRFFDVTSLAGIRAEDPHVFATSHAELLDLQATGVVDAFRIDHPDGMADPGDYLDRLAEASGGAWVVVEKILEPGERLPDDWRTAGTTGYDAMRLLDGVLLDPAGEEPLDAAWREVDPRPWPQVVEQAKRLVLERVLAPELGRLERLLRTPALAEPLRELLVAMPVYRTYLRDDQEPSAADLAVLAHARALAAERRPDLAPGVADVVDLLVNGGDARLTTLFQQTTGPVTAKAVEDTAMYRYHRLVALNEVGGDPGSWGVDLAEWHESCYERQQRWPDAMTALSTHDTKRSHDVRARLLGLAELHPAWTAGAPRWLDRLESLGVPDRPTAYLLLQSLLGAWPIGADRLGPYLEKATREAKERTSWTDPDPDYDTALQQAVKAACADAALLHELTPLAARLTRLGRRSALSGLALALTMPGVPDTYQGGELEDLSLVDPDNRRPVDHARRARLQEELEGSPTGAVLERVEDGLPKLALVRAVLRVRRDRPEAFGPEASYDPLPTSGPHADRLVAFSRGEVVTVAPRWTAGFDDWEATSVDLPAGSWRDAVTGVPVAGGRARAGELLDGFPVAVLTREDS